MLKQDLRLPHLQELQVNIILAPSGFGGELPGCADMTPIVGELVIVDDGTDPTSDGCEPIQNDLTGKIALIDRGACEFGVKCLNAENAGANNGCRL